jgi:hypothetical protein
MAEFWTAYRGRIRNPQHCVGKDHDDPGPVIPASEKRAVSKNLDLTGRISLSQYEVLVSNGFDGEKVKDWTAHHAQVVIDKERLELLEYVSCPQCAKRILAKRLPDHLRTSHQLD